MKLQRFTVLILLLLAVSLRAQQYDFRHFTIEDGLPSSYLHQILQDSKGYLWFATNNGVSSYDGHSFRTFTTADGFTDYGAFRMMEDSYGRLWFMTFSGKVCWYRDGKFVPFTYNENGQRLKICWVVEDRNRILWFGTEEGIVLQLHPDGSIRSVPVVTDQLFFRKLTHSFPVPGGVIFFSQDFYFVSDDLRVKRMPYTNNLPIMVRFFSLRNGTVLLTNHSGIHAIDSTGQRLLLPFGPQMHGEIYDIHEDDEGNIWVGSTSGLHYFPGGNLAYDGAQHMLADRRVMFITRDHEGNYWFATDNGAFMLSSLNVRVYREQEGLSTRQLIAMERFGERGLVLLARDGSFYQLHNQKLERLPFSVAQYAPLHPETTILASIARDSLLLFVAGGGTYLLDRHGFRLMSLIYPWYRHSDGSYWSYEYDGFYRLHEGQRQKIYPRLDSHYIYSIHHKFIVDDNYRCWIGTRLGLNRQDANGILRYGNTRPDDMLTFVIDLAMSRDGSIWAATKGQGVFYIRNDTLITQITTADGLAGNNCELVMIDDDDNVWVAGFNGLSRIVVRNGKPVVVRTFSAGNILPSDDIQAVARYGDTVYVAGNEGLTVFDERLISPNTTPPPVYITRVTVAGQAVPFGETCTVDYRSGAITVEYTGIVFRKPGIRAYRYRFSSDTTWNSTQSSSVQFPSLEPGTYVLEVMAQNNDGVWSAAPAVLTLVVRPPYWQSWWFRGVVAVLAIAVAGVASALFIRRRDRKNALQRTMLEMELRALRSQMNPHFIFNALNSIQDFILHKQSRTANLYLTKFARLMRMILEYSRQSTISLDDELDFLRLYIDLEQLRFEPSFAYRIQVDPALRGGYVRIPPMIVQPIVENALKHGLASRPDSGLLSLSFEKRGDMLHCTVQDNGIGRQESERLLQNSGRTYESIGLANIRERLALALGHGSSDALQITDLYDDHGNAAGTKVEIELPLT